tara:strand:- start:112 stop:306 length:195 start_codon:yes stop_codon:yes gene_type:complete
MTNLSETFWRNLKRFNSILYVGIFFWCVHIVFGNQGILAATSVFIIGGIAIFTFNQFVSQKTNR